MRWIVGIAVFLLLAGFAAWKIEPILLKASAWRTEKTTLTEHLAFLEDHITVLTPERGEGPFPTVIQFHGCAGLRQQFNETWARRANDAGYAAVLVDSNRAREISYEESLETVCKGKALLGQERAGDVLAAISYIENDPRLDAGRLILAGWSHGAWTVMDFLTMDMTRARPANLADDVLARPDVDGAILFYPHCGPGALSRLRRWTEETPVLAFVAGRDSIVEAQPCIDFFTRQKNEGSPTDLVIYPDADHIFDDATLVSEHPQFYDEPSARDAAERYGAFLRKLMKDA